MNRTPSTQVAPTGALGAYRALPRLAGRSFLPIAFLARLPFSMTTLGVLVLVTDATGSLATAGLATAAASLGTAALGAVQGRLADRYGQRRVVGVVSLLQAAAALAVVAAAGRASTAVLLLACAALGASAPQIGAFARVRWIALAEHDGRTLGAAMSYESTVDEITFVLGPALVGIIAASGEPAWALGVAAALVAIFGVAFALHPTARAPRRAPEARGERIGTRAVLRLVAAPATGMLALGVFFGGTQASVTAVAAAEGRPGLAGLLYAVVGIGSAVTALSVVALPASFSLERRWTVAAAGLFAACAVTLLVTTLGGLVAALAVVGLFVGPTIVTLFSVAGERAPTPAAGTAMTLMVSANVVGVAIGAAAAGAVAEGGTAGAAFWVPVLAAGVLTVTGALAARTRRVAG